MSRTVQDRPPTEMPQSVNAPGPSAAIDIFDDTIEFREFEILPEDNACRSGVS